MTVKLHTSVEIISMLIEAEDHIPNNSKYPFLIYRNVFKENKLDENDIKNLLKQNEWVRSWTDSIYDYSHYHSNNHEVLVIANGFGKVQIGGDNGKIFKIETGDVLIIPAGVAHKSIELSSDFSCVGAYAFDVQYDICDEDQSELKAKKNIQKVKLPKFDPIYRDTGYLFHYWK